MKKLFALCAIALSLAGCADLQIPKRGFMTRTLLGPETASPDTSGVPASYRFCVARGYRPQTADFERCRYSIDSRPQR